ncbi:Flp pilus assembly protein CpaB [Rhodobacteraceae bacterium WD3A24]|nr:Flp pilus assembly protein CpaB [Rhodobacteraceae bacterium WD3A24]
MRIVFSLVLLLGVGLAGFAAYMVQDYISRQQAALAQARAQQGPAVEMTEVMVTTEAVRYGQVLSPEAVETVAWPADAVPEGTFTDRSELFPEGAGRRVVLRAMEPSEPIMAVKVSDPGREAGITSRLSEGMRAFTIRVDLTTGVSGFLRPGDRVDVYWTGRRDRNGGDITRLIESELRLIAVDQSADQDRENATVNPNTVTVEVTPQQVAALAQAQSTGRISLSLVGAMDQTRAGAVEIDQRELLGIQRAEPAPEPEPEPSCSVRTRRGSEVVEIEIPCTN